MISTFGKNGKYKKLDSNLQALGYQFVNITHVSKERRNLSIFLHFDQLWNLMIKSHKFTWYFTNLIQYYNSTMAVNVQPTKNKSQITEIGTLQCCLILAAVRLAAVVLVVGVESLASTPVCWATARGRRSTSCRRAGRPPLDVSHASTPPSLPPRWLVPPSLARRVDRRQSPLLVQQALATAAPPPSSNPSFCLSPRALILASQQQQFLSAASWEQIDLVFNCR